MNDIVKSQSSVLAALHGKNGEISLPKPFERDIFLFDTYVAGTTHIEGMEELEPACRLKISFRFSENRIIALMIRPL